MLAKRLHNVTAPDPPELLQTNSQHVLLFHAEHIHIARMCSSSLLGSYDFGATPSRTLQATH